MNPPYASSGSDTIHLKFVDKVLDIADKQITIMPFSFVTKLENKAGNKFKENFSKFLLEVEEQDSAQFAGTSMPNVAIYNFFSNKQNKEDIEIVYLTGKSEKLHSLLDKSNYTDYEKALFNYLDKNGEQQILGDCGRLNSWKSEISKYDNPDKRLLELVEKSIKKMKECLNKKQKYFLIVNRANGGKNGTAINKNNGDILSNYEDIKKYFFDKKLAIGNNALVFNNFIDAQNCKIAIQNPVLRYSIYKEQDDQNMTVRIYKHIPNIDWSNPKVKTDEGLLELCGCPKDKAKEYAQYCKDIIERVDKGERP